VIDCYDVGVVAYAENDEVIKKIILPGTPSRGTLSILYGQLIECRLWLEVLPVLAPHATTSDLVTVLISHTQHYQAQALRVARNAAGIVRLCDANVAAAQSYTAAPVYIPPVQPPPVVNVYPNSDSHVIYTDPPRSGQIGAGLGAGMGVGFVQGMNAARLQQAMYERNTFYNLAVNAVQIAKEYEDILGD
jgi:hypothetical protein